MAQQCWPLRHLHSAVPVFLVPLHTITAPEFFCSEEFSASCSLSGAPKCRRPLEHLSCSGRGCPTCSSDWPRAADSQGMARLPLVLCISSALDHISPAFCPAWGGICLESRVQPGNTRETSHFTPGSCGILGVAPSWGCMRFVWRDAPGGLCSILAGVSYRCHFPQPPACVCVVCWHSPQPCVHRRSCFLINWPDFPPSPKQPLRMGCGRHSFFLEAAELQPWARAAGQ